MITADIVQRTFFIQVGDSTASGFVYSFNGSEYLITAKHVFDGNAPDALDMFHERQWKKFEIETRFADNDVDLAVAKLPMRAKENSTVRLDLGEVIIGEDVFAVGYPLSLYQEAGDINAGFPLPFVAKGCFSAIDIEPGEPAKGLFVSGQIDEGYSGGPIVRTRRENNQSQIVGFVAHNLFKRSRQSIDNGQTIIVTYPSNLIYGVSASTALEIIEAWDN